MLVYIIALIIFIAASVFYRHIRYYHALEKEEILQLLERLYQAEQETAAMQMRLQELDKKKARLNAEHTELLATQDLLKAEIKKQMNWYNHMTINNHKTYNILSEDFNAESFLAKHSRT